MSSTSSLGSGRKTGIFVQMGSPLYRLLNQINDAAKAGLDLIAIGMAVALPAICASLAMENGRAQRDEYKDWCAANLTSQKFTGITPDQLYSWRCGVLHQGRFDDIRHGGLSRVIFVPPGGAKITDCNVRGAYLYGVVEFCRNMSDAAFQWFETHKEDAVVQRNAERLMQYYPNGLPGYVVGTTVVA